MLSFAFGVVSLLLAVMMRALYKTYHLVPPKELKRLARRGDEVASLLYRPVAFGLSLQLLLGAFGAIFAVLSLVLFVQVVGIWLAVLILLILSVASGFFLVPSNNLTRSGLWLASRLAPAIAGLLERINPVIDYAARSVRKLRPLRLHTGLYEKADLVQLLEAQKNQPDNRISLGEIDLLQHALTFGDTVVLDALIPKRVVNFVSAEESIGPILMGELHKSGHSRFPVYADDKRDNIVGILYLHDLVASKHTGHVKSIMKTKLTYVHEDFTLYQTLQAFLRTKQHLFLVVNSFEEFVGIITIEDVMEQMIGGPIVDEFDRYDDLRAVAAAAAYKEHVQHKKTKSEPVEPQATPEPTEVVK